jgi:hypothetical protein
MEMERVLALDGRVVATIWAPLEKNPYFQAQRNALRTFVGESADDGILLAVRDDGDEYLKEAFIEGGLEEIEVSLVEATVDIPHIAQWSCEQIMGTPRGPVFAELPQPEQEQYGESFVDALAQYIGDDDVARVPYASWLITGRKI